MTILRPKSSPLTTQQIPWKPFPVSSTFEYQDSILILFRKAIEVSYIDMAKQTLRVCSTRRLVTHIFLLTDNFAVSGEDLRGVPEPHYP